MSKRAKGVTHYQDIVFQPKFHCGSVALTDGALDALEESGQDALFFLSKHLSGDWGEADAEVADLAVARGWPVMSMYSTLLGDPLWVVTQSNRALTIFMTPRDYGTVMSGEFERSLRELPPEEFQ